MKKGFKLILFFSLMVLASCEKNEPAMNNSEKLIGYWVNPVLVDALWKYQRATTLKDNMIIRMSTCCAELKIQERSSDILVAMKL
ncbi:MAG: hypothetical protein QM800_03945 [Paludibacter sp.]